MNNESILVATMNSPVVTVNSRIMAIVLIEFFKHTYSELPFMIYYIN